MIAVVVLIEGVDAAIAHGLALRAAGALALARRLRTRLHAEEAHVELQLPWFIEKRAPVSGGGAFVDYEVTWEAVAAARGEPLEAVAEATTQNFFRLFKDARP